MMARRIISILAIWLLLAGAARAAALTSFDPQGNYTGATTSWTYALSNKIVGKELLTACVHPMGGAAPPTSFSATFNGRAATQIGSTVTIGNSATACFKITAQAGDAGTNFVANW